VYGRCCANRIDVGEIADAHGETATGCVASPLGAWVLRALVAPTATGQAREELVEVLGVDPDDSAAHARSSARVTG
jgi:hypothetical protein